MNILNRKFSTREKILLLVLVVIIVAALYYMFVYQPLTNALNTSKSNAEALEMQLVALGFSEKKQ